MKSLFYLTAAALALAPHKRTLLAAITLGRDAWRVMQGCLLRLSPTLSPSSGPVSMPEQITAIEPSASRSVRPRRGPDRDRAEVRRSDAYRWDCAAVLSRILALLGRA